MVEDYQYIPPGWVWPVGPPPERIVAPPVVTPHASPPPEIVGLPRNQARFIIGYENAVNIISEIHTSYTTGPTTFRPARDDPVNPD